MSWIWRRRIATTLGAQVRDVATVKATFDRTEQYLSGNSTIPVRVRLVKDLTRSLSYDRYIEIGCGDGSIGLGLMEGSRELTLLDLSGSMIALARKNTPPAAADRVTYVVGDVNHFIPERPFDLLICMGVIAHVRSIRELLTTIGSFLNDNGYLIIQFTESRSLFGKLIGTFANKAIGGYEMGQTSYDDLVSVLANLGFRPLKRVSYLDFSFGLRRLSHQGAVSLKLFTARLHMPYLFSESIVLFRRTV